jgi:hypothetical protein
VDSNLKIFPFHNFLTSKIYIQLKKSQKFPFQHFLTQKSAFNPQNPYLSTISKQTDIEKEAQFNTTTNNSLSISTLPQIFTTFENVVKHEKGNDKPRDDRLFYGLAEARCLRQAKSESFQ